MRGARLIHNHLAVADAAHFVFAHILRLSPTDRDPDPRHWSLRVRKRYAALRTPANLLPSCFTAAIRHTKQIF